MTFLRHLAGVAAYFSLAATGLAAPLERVCDDIEHCIYILEKHAPDSFDYEVLHKEFLDFGSKSTGALVEVAAWMDDPKSSYALEMLSRGGFRLSPAAQRDLIEVWPRENVKAHAKVLGRMASPRVRAAAIDTLDHADPAVREQSRHLLSQVAKARFKFPMRQGDYSKLLGAALDEPHPALIALLETYPPAQLRPAYARLLRSGDAATTIAVYEKFYQVDKANALKTMVGVIQDLDDDEFEAALALSEMLQQRNKKRPDQFYLKFAKDLTEDTELGLAGRAVGYDALMNSQQIIAKNKMPALLLPDTELNRSVFRYVVSAAAPRESYRNYLGALTSKSADPYIAALSAAYGKNLDPIFITKLGRFETRKAKALVEKSLKSPFDYRVISAGGLAAAQQKQMLLRPQIAKFKSSHPISSVRLATGLALKQFAAPSKISSAERLYLSVSNMTLVGVNKGEAYCKVESVDFKSLSRNMPFFEGGKLEDDIPASRSYLRSSAELKSGWLAGYHGTQFGGGLLYYDYDTKRPQTLLSENVLAIIPIQAVPLGRYPTSFWVITDGLDGASSVGGLYRALQRGDEFQMQLHAVLPGRASRIAINSNNSIAMDFVDRDEMKRKPKTKDKYSYNPPLLLGANGSISRLCRRGATQQADSTP